VKGHDKIAVAPAQLNIRKYGLENQDVTYQPMTEQEVCISSKLATIKTKGALQIIRNEQVAEKRPRGDESWAGYRIGFPTPHCP